jgi:hypothetical protein
MLVRGSARPSFSERTRTVFPRDLFLNYHMCHNCFLLMVLGMSGRKAGRVLLRQIGRQKDEAAR